MKNIDKVRKLLPTLDYLLNNLSNLPWSDIKPDNLKVNYLSLTAIAELKDKSVTEKLFSKNNKLKYLYITFKPEGIILTEKKPGEVYPNFSITCNIELVCPNRIRLIPKCLELHGTYLSPEIVDKLIKNYHMEFDLPKIPYKLKVTSISTADGKLIIRLTK